MTTISKADFSAILQSAIDAAAWCGDWEDLPEARQHGAGVASIGITQIHRGRTSFTANPTFRAKFKRELRARGIVVK